jgi:uncharacterized FlaG/YvyC family protein
LNKGDLLSDPFLGFISGEKTMNNILNTTSLITDSAYNFKTNANSDYNKNDETTAPVNKETSVNNADIVNSTSLVDKVNKANISDDLKKDETTDKDIENALDVVSSFMKNSNKKISFSNDNINGKTIITITDEKTQEVINQFPSEKIILMAERIQELYEEAKTISGLLVDSRV